MFFWPIRYFIFRVKIQNCEGTLPQGPTDMFEGSDRSNLEKGSILSHVAGGLSPIHKILLRYVNINETLHYIELIQYIGNYGGDCKQKLPSTYACRLWTVKVDEDYHVQIIPTNKKS